jgi:hypothetical protein
MMPSATELRLSSRTTEIGYTLLRPVADALSTSTGFCRSVESFFPYRRQT